MQVWPKVLFFIDGPTPTAEQLETAKDYGPGVAFRNARLIRQGEPIEDADGIAGTAPEAYKLALPDIGDREAVKKRMEARRDGTIDMTDEEKETRAKNDMLRGARPATANERVSDPSVPIGERKSQSGEPRVAPPKDDAGWKTGKEAPAASGAAPAGSAPATPASAPPPGGKPQAPAPAAKTSR